MKLIHKISLFQASLYFDSKDPKVFYKYPVPSYILKRTERKFVNQFNQLFSGNEPKLKIEDEKYKLIIYNKAFNILPAMYEGIISSLKSDDTENLKVLFKAFADEYGKEFKTVNDLILLEKQIEFYRGKYTAILNKSKQANKDNQNEKPFDFEEMIISIELALNININRSLKVYQLKPYYDRAIKMNDKK